MSAASRSQSSSSFVRQAPDREREKKEKPASTLHKGRN